MKKIKSFLLAFVLFALTVCVLHVVSRSSIAESSRAWATAGREKNAGSFQGITANLTEHTIPVFGSSEFQHGRETSYHPSKVFTGTQNYPILIGAGYYQSLGHAITLSAIAPYMVNKKAVLIISPQWFRKTGVVDQAFISRFSELYYIKMLENEELSEEVKTYIIDRTEHLLKSDEKMQQRVTMYKEALINQDAAFLQKLQTGFWKQFLTEKDAIMTWEAALGYPNESVQEMQTDEPDWEALLQQAQEEGEKENTNPLYINDDVYKVLEKVLDQKKDMNKDAEKGYQTGPEFDDLACFLEVCEDLSIEPLLVIVPVNGYYYDHTGFPVSARNAYYQKIKKIADEHNAAYADFSDQEYTKYFFEDRVHIGKKGWVMVNESISSFFG